MTVKEIFAKQLKIDEEEIDENASIKYDLGVDSLDLMSIISIMEQIYDVKVDIDEIKDIDTIAQIEAFIKNKTENS